MSSYSKLIREATGVTDQKSLDQIEEILRQDVFHSTLDWQSRAQLMKGAKEALELWKDMKKHKIISRALARING
jgi:hypothetical protein